MIASEAWLRDDGAHLVAGALALVAMLAMARIAWRQARTPAPLRAHPLRLGLLLVAQPLLAAALHGLLLPPTRPARMDSLVVATAGTPPRQWAMATGAARIALPEAPDLPGATREPDLATALRRHPGARRLHILGAGLEARDRDLAATRALAFDAAPLPRGLVQLDAPADVVAGAGFAVTGRAHDVAGGAVELVDPAGRVVDRAALSAPGRFALAGMTRAPGSATFRLRLLDARRRTIETATVPVQALPATPPRLLVLAGAPGPEVKFLRRWARDAGLPMRTSIDAGAGMQLGDAPMRVDAGTLSAVDVVVLDERAWSALGEPSRDALVAAVRAGLGMILRVTGPLDPAQRRRLRGLGFAVDEGRESDPEKLLPPPRDEATLRARLGPGTRDAPRRADAPLPEVPLLTRRRLRVQAADAVALASPAAGVAPATWRAEGRGRVAVWTLADTHALVLAGRDDLHHALWSDAVATVARPRGETRALIEGALREGRRIALCGVDAGVVVAPSGRATALTVDPLTGPRRCAAYWPASAGWHRLRWNGGEQRFHVRAAADAPGLAAFERREATLALRSPAPVAATPTRTPGVPGPRWPWLLAFLLLAAGAWWLERSKRGRPS